MRRVFVLLAFGAVSFSLLAPQRINAQAAVGVRAGLNLATFGGSDLSPQGHHTRYNRHGAVNVGAFLGFPLSGRFELQIGAGYSGKGAEVAFSLDGGETVSGTGETRIGYLEIPALMKFRLTPGRRVSTHLLAGPSVSFRVSCESVTDAPIWGGQQKCADAGLDVRETDFGVTGGVGAEFELPNGLILVGESLYSVGLRTVGESGDGVKNRAFSLSLGVAYPIG